MFCKLKLGICKKTRAIKIDICKYDRKLEFIDHFLFKCP